VLEAHCTQVCVVVSQTGVAPLQFAFDWQVPTQVYAGEHAWFAPQLAVVRHCTQVPAGSQYGVPDGQFVLDRHSTQAFVVVSQCGAAAGQFVSLRHCTHFIVVVSQTGVAPPQFASVVQPAMHSCVCESQTDMPVGQLLFVRHCTHVSVV
jgi:hypothetical protein